MKDMEFKLSEQGNAIYVCCDGEKVDRTNDILTVVRDYMLDKMIDMNQPVGVRWVVEDIGSVTLALIVRTPDEDKISTSPAQEKPEQNKSSACGRWMDDGYGSYILVCSNCGHKPRHDNGKPLYGEPCPHCGSVNEGGRR